MKYRYSRRFAAAALFFFALAAVAADKYTLPAAKQADQYPAKETHDTEKVAVAADPFDTKAKTGVFRVDYLKHGLMPVRLIVTNHGDKPIRLDQVRAYYIAADGEKLKTITMEQAERRMRDLKQDPSRGMEAPFPFKRSPHEATKTSDVSKDYDEAAFADLTVAPGATQSGVLFFDISDYSHPLKAASLYIKEMKNDAGQDMFPFEVKFDKYLDSQTHHE